MVAVRLFGGLGNQLFQYAAGLALSKYLNTELIIDTSFLLGRQLGVTKRDFGLNNFQLEGVVSKGLFGPILFRLSKLPFFFNLLTGWEFVNENQLSSPSDFFGLKKDSYLVGYWQSQTYFEFLKTDTLFNCFPSKDKLSLANAQTLREIENSNSVGLHVRRGDYVTSSKANKCNGVLPIDFYSDAIAAINNRVKNPHFYIFSDDIEWCKLNLAFPQCQGHTYVENNGATWEDMVMMGFCKHQIIANSTFSWWGAWLGDHISGAKSRYVIAPRRWYSDPDRDVSLGFFPAHWILLH